MRKRPIPRRSNGSGSNQASVLPQVSGPFSFCIVEDASAFRLEKAEGYSCLSCRSCPTLLFILAVAKKCRQCIQHPGLVPTHVGCLDRQGRIFLIVKEPFLIPHILDRPFETDLASPAPPLLLLPSVTSCDKGSGQRRECRWDRSGYENT